MPCRIGRTTPWTACRHKEKTHEEDHEHHPAHGRPRAGLRPHRAGHQRLQRNAGRRQLHPAPVVPEGQLPRRLLGHQQSSGGHGHQQWPGRHRGAELPVHPGGRRRRGHGRISGL